jgi:hypothetical protein
MALHGRGNSGPVSRSVGDLLVALGCHDEAEPLFAHATASSEKAEAKYFRAQADLSWGRMLVERRASGDAQRAHDLLSRARRSAASLGYGTVERRAASALQLVGG